MEGICPHCLMPIPESTGICAGCSAGSPSSAPFPDASGGPPPAFPDRWRIRRFLGRGGMGRVYLCEDTDLEVEIAVKVLPAELATNEAAMQVIEREARLAAKLRGCPGILQLYEFERHEGSALLVMEYAPGGSLHARIRRGPPLTEEECRRYGAGIADALAFAHDRRILHRDVKPANVLLGADGGPRVADFGLARVLAETSSQMSSSTGMAGTPVYLPPEVIDRQKVDHRGDLYSLGCVLYEMATAEPPYAGTFAEVALAKSTRDARLPDPRERRPEFSEDYAAAARCLMARDPVERYADARTAAAVLRGTAKAAASAPGRRESSLSHLPVEPAVPGLPPPVPLPEGAAEMFPKGFVEHGRRVWSLKDGAEMAFVPAGPFTMGSDRGAADEAPVREVHLSPFLIDRHEVTLFQFRRFCGETGGAMPDQPSGANDRHPVVGITWEEAVAYARWAGKYLPTEAQWEKAARGSDGRDFPWGNEPPGDDQTLYQDPSGGHISVGSFPAGRSPFGCLDMIGNAWEWVADWYAGDAYALGAVRDPIGPTEGQSRVLRGGAWDDPKDRLRVTKRRRSRPGSRYDFVGFRCVRDIPNPTRIAGLRA